MIKSFVSALMLSVIAASGQKCEDSYWPIYAGGANGHEDVRCFVFDQISEYIIVGGVTTSDDFGPSGSEHGYMFALDLEGNWKWGRYF